MLSKMMFAAIHLTPSQSNNCSSIPGFIPTPSSDDGASSLAGKAKRLLFPGPDAPGYARKQPPLLLWGLTLGVVSDFLEHIPPHNALELWTYPTFTNWDVRFVMWAMSYRFRRQKALEMSSTTTTATDDKAGTDTIEEEKEGEGEDEEQPGEVGIAGLGVGRNWGKTGRAKMIARGAAVNSMLEGYYPIVRRAVTVALVGRITVVALLGAYAWRKYRP